jgi:hypothetical protein
MIVRFRVASLEPEPGQLSLHSSEIAGPSPFLQILPPAAPSSAFTYVSANAWNHCRANFADGLAADV